MFFGDYKRKELSPVCPANFVSLLKEFFLSTVISVLFVVVVVVVLVLCIPIFLASFWGQ